jgi:hypothetical protein
MPQTENQFAWQPQPQAAELVERLLAEFCDRCPDARRFADRLLEETGTRLIDWTDHIGLPRENNLASPLEQAGFARTDQASDSIWQHAGGLFPQVFIGDLSARRLVLRVESVADFLVAHGLSEMPIEGRPLSPLRKARIAASPAAALWVVERHGFAGWHAPESRHAPAGGILWHQEAFRRRRRRFSQAEDGFQHALDLARAAVADLGTGWASELFFAAERDYFDRRNHAARVQKARQDALGLGWQNHDHHTYRSSRPHFAGLIRVLEALGLACRERFYAGREAGWGAQVLEQPETGVAVFADVDLGPEEVVGDFAHQPLPSRDHFGTVGLWCLLHGEAMLEAGLHHLAYRADFDAARRQLPSAGVPVLKPFTDLPYLKQAFTEGERWPLDAGERLAAALAARAITPAEADRFRRHGAIGSHLEILERNQGYKGFNQAGINEIIRDTDPRRQHAPAPAAGA